MSLKSYKNPIEDVIRPNWEEETKMIESSFSTKMKNILRTIPFFIFSVIQIGGKNVNLIKQTYKAYLKVIKKNTINKEDSIVLKIFHLTYDIIEDVIVNGTDNIESFILVAELTETIFYNIPETINVMKIIYENDMEFKKNINKRELFANLLSILRGFKEIKNTAKHDIVMGKLDMDYIKKSGTDIKNFNDMVYKGENRLTTIEKKILSLEDYAIKFIIDNEQEYINLIRSRVFRTLLSQDNTIINLYKNTTQGNPIELEHFFLLPIVKKELKTSHILENILKDNYGILLKYYTENQATRKKFVDIMLEDDDVNNSLMIDKDIMKQGYNKMLNELKGKNNNNNKKNNNNNKKNNNNYRDFIKKYKNDLYQEKDKGNFYKIVSSVKSAFNNFNNHHPNKEDNNKKFDNFIKIELQNLIKKKFKS